MHREELVLSLKGFNVGTGKFISEATQPLDAFYFIAVKYIYRELKRETVSCFSLVCFKFLS